MHAKFGGELCMQKNCARKFGRVGCARRRILRTGKYCAQNLVADCACRRFLQTEKLCTQKNRADCACRRILQTGKLCTQKNTDNLCWHTKSARTIALPTQSLDNPMLCSHNSPETSCWHITFGGVSCGIGNGTSCGAEGTVRAVGS